MTSRFGPFNIILLLTLAAVVSGCKTTEEKKRSKEATTLRLHLETSGGSDRSQGITVFRASPQTINAERDPFLTEGDVEAAAILAAPGGFSIRVQFNRHGTLVLDNMTTSYRGKRLAIFSQFGDARWLAAPMISARITNGQLTFTPDATYEEAERIVRGLNNIAAAVQKKQRF